MTTTDTGQSQPELSYRAATETDAGALAELVNSCYRGESSRQGWTTEADLLSGQRIDAEAVGALIQRPDTTILLAESDRALVACCELQRGVNGTYFGMFSVCPRSQGMGLGRRVLAEAEYTAARLWRSRLMRMKVIKQRTELIAWYERRGYTSTGRTEPFPYGDAAFGEPQRQDLAFVELTKELQPIA
ncbi:GNAT family N-acetyltransferase [Nocardiopsis xinjiangensis]|uniref:GNAT family N-acetyltransferase n=1 Tax=Nocardiopsis xinjiangensis TaxID=124285 RepID=UPI0003490219|nr:GNAT family N-acetyltransferase [Nocardiopsis xinjiangensis]